MKNSYALNGLVLKVWLKQPNVSLCRCYFGVLSKNLAEWGRRAQMGGRLLDFHYLLRLVMPLQPLTLPNTCMCHKILWFC